MSFLFNSFEGWKQYCEANNVQLFEAVIEYETVQKGKQEQAIWDGLQQAYEVMKDAVETGLNEEMTSRSGMINNGAKKVYKHPVAVLSPEFQILRGR